MNKNTLNKDHFFKEISDLTDYCDLRMVESLYYSMVRVITRNLKLGKEVKLPDFGHFYVHNAAPRQALNVKTGKINSIGMKKYVKFRPSVKLKAYFQNLE